MVNSEQSRKPDTVSQLLPTEGRMSDVSTPITGLRWWRRRRFLKAYRILRNEAERHTDAGHDMTFSVINEAHIIVHCRSCPELLP
jgi:hypothetical protein